MRIFFLGGGGGGGEKKKKKKKIALRARIRSRRTSGGLRTSAHHAARRRAWSCSATSADRAPSSASTTWSGSASRTRRPAWGVGVPDDLWVAGYDDIPMAMRGTGSTSTSVSQPIERWRRTPSSASSDGSRTRTSQRVTDVSHAELVVRGSTGGAPPRARWRSTQALEHQGHALPAGDAHRLEGELLVAPAHRFSTSWRSGGRSCRTGDPARSRHR